MSRKCATDDNSLMARTLTDFEKHLLETQEMMMIRGKVGFNQFETQNDVSVNLNATCNKFPTKMNIQHIFNSVIPYFNTYKIYLPIIIRLFSVWAVIYHNNETSSVITHTKCMICLDVYVQLHLKKRYSF